MTKEERNEHWQRIIAEQEASGMTARAFCLQRHMNPSRFYHWRLRLREHNVSVQQTHLVRGLLDAYAKTKIGAT